MSLETPQHWTLEQCAKKLMEGDKADEISDIIWELRGTVFFTLQKMRKFDDTTEGPDAQPSVDRIIKKLIEVN